VSTTDTSTAEAVTSRRIVLGVFNSPGDAENALNGLREAGVNPEQVSVVARQADETQAVAENTGMGVAGTLYGGITGGIVGWLVGVGALAIPGIGPIVAAGALATTLGGAAIGAAAGGLLGALVDEGVPEEDARGYEESVRQGGIVLMAKAESDQQMLQAQQLFDRHGGVDVRRYGGSDAGGDVRTHGDASSGVF
jgi:uncharacterized membrane protein